MFEMCTFLEDSHLTYVVVDSNGLNFSRIFEMLYLTFFHIFNMWEVIILW